MHFERVENAAELVVRVQPDAEGFLAGVRARDGVNDTERSVEEAVALFGKSSLQGIPPPPNPPKEGLFGGMAGAGWGGGGGGMEVAGGGGL